MKISIALCVKNYNASGTEVYILCIHTVYWVKLASPSLSLLVEQLPFAIPQSQNLIFPIATCKTSFTKLIKAVNNSFQMRMHLFYNFESSCSECLAPQQYLHPQFEQGYYLICTYSSSKSIDLPQFIQAQEQLVVVITIEASVLDNTSHFVAHTSQTSYHIKASTYQVLLFIATKL